MIVITRFNSFISFVVYVKKKKKKKNRCVAVVAIVGVVHELRCVCVIRAASIRRTIHCTLNSLLFSLFGLVGLAGWLANQDDDETERSWLIAGLYRIAFI